MQAVPSSRPLGFDITYSLDDTKAPPRLRSRFAAGSHATLAVWPDQTVGDAIRTAFKVEHKIVSDQPNLDATTGEELRAILERKPNRVIYVFRCVSEFG